MCDHCSFPTERIFSAKFSIHGDHDHARLEMMQYFGKDDTERLENARIDAKEFEQQLSEMKSTGKPKEIDWMERVTEMENTPEEKCLEMIHTHEKANDAIIRKEDKILNYAMEAAEAGKPCPV